YTGNLTHNDFKKSIENAGYNLFKDKTRPNESQAEVSRQRSKEKLDKARSQMWWSWGLTIPIILWMIPDMVWGYTFLGGLGYDIGMIVLSVLVIFYAGWNTMKSAWASS